MDSSNRKFSCNLCGKMLALRNGITCEDYVYVRKEWGYFSQKDGKTQIFRLCEECMGSLEKKFVIPSEIENTTELL